MHFDKNRIRTPRNFRDKKLLIQFKEIEEVTSKSSRLSYEVIGINPRNIPESYRITYKAKSIIGINEDSSPIFGFEHTARLTFPQTYPATSDPIYVMESDIWHPNIKHAEPGKGRICTNSKLLSKHNDASYYIITVGEILQFKNYWAMPEPPYPEDDEVAQWVREYAEPNDIVNSVKGIVLDPDELLDGEPNADYYPPTPPKESGDDAEGGIVIGDIIFPEGNNSASPPNPEMDMDEDDSDITIII